jgi:hypothetical protein
MKHKGTQSLGRTKNLLYESAVAFYKRAVMIYEQVWGLEHGELTHLVEEYTGLICKKGRE